MEAERAERAGDLARVAEIRYGLLPELERELSERAEPTRGRARWSRRRSTRTTSPSVVAQWTGIPTDRLLEGEVEKLVHMEERLHERVVGQDAAIEAVSNALRRARSGLQDPNRPIGSFVFLGPTGVGKTELARALAEFMFDDDRAIVRLDMSEYQEKHTVSRLVGAPPGYVGYEEGGQLTEAVRRRPYSRDPARRDREGARRGLRRAAAAARRRPADRRPGPHGRLPQHRRDHDLEHPLGRRPGRAVPARVPQPDRRDRRLRRAHARAARRDRDHAARPAQRPARRARPRARAHRGRPRADRGGRLGSRVRRAPAQAGDPAPAREPARAAAARGRVPRGRHDPRVRRARRDPLRGRRRRAGESSPSPRSRSASRAERGCGGSRPPAGAPGDQA